MAGRQFQLRVRRKNAFPTAAGLVKEALDFVTQLGFGFAIVLENQVALFVATTFQLVVQLGEDEFEQLFKNVYAGIG